MKFLIGRRFMPNCSRRFVVVGDRKGDRAPRERAGLLCHEWAFVAGRDA
jgi:hypothetical protein